MASSDSVAAKDDGGSAAAPTDAPRPPDDGSGTAGEDTAATKAAEAHRRAAEDTLLGVLATKTLMRHLRNRHRSLGPAPLDLGAIESDEAKLLIRTMIAAAQADGRIDSRERSHILGALDRLGLAEDQRPFVEEAMRASIPLNDVVRAVDGPQTAAHVYAVSLLAVDKNAPVVRAYLEYLAARLRLPRDVVTRLHQQFGFGRSGAGG